MSLRNRQRSRNGIMKGRRYLAGTGNFSIPSTPYPQGLVSLLPINISSLLILPGSVQPDGIECPAVCSALRNPSHERINHGTDSSTLFIRHPEPMAGMPLPGGTEKCSTKIFYRKCCCDSYVFLRSLPHDFYQRISKTTRGFIVYAVYTNKSKHLTQSKFFQPAPVIARYRHPGQWLLHSQNTIIRG